MMDGTKQSDSSIVAMKRANKEGEPSAEPVERRDGTKGNSVGQSTRRTQSRGSVFQAVDRIRRAIAPLQLGTVATDDGIALAIREDPSPVAGAAVPLAVHTQGRSRMP